MNNLMLWLAFSLLWIFQPAPAMTQEADPGLVVTWATDEGLFVWESASEQTRQLVEGVGIIQPTLSADGSLIIYQQDSTIGDNGLWLVDSAGREPRLLHTLAEDMILAQVFWLGESGLLFNTYQQDPPLGLKFNEIITHLDVTSGQSRAIEPGGHMSLNPSGTMLGVTRAGKYVEEQGSIWLVDLLAEREPVQIQTFDAPATGSHQAYYPVLHWLDDISFVYALPEPDAIYAGLGVNPVIALYQAGIDGKVQPLGTIEADLFGMPRWSPDGTHIAYMRTASVSTPGDSTQIVLAQTDGSGEQIMATFSLQIVSNLFWLDSTHFAFFRESALWRGSMDGEVRHWLEESGPFIQVLDGLLVYAILGEPVQVVYASPDQSEPVTVAEVSALFGLDAIHLP